MADLHRHLVGGTADPLGLDFQDGSGVADGHLEDLERLSALALLDPGQGVINDLLGSAALAVQHDAVDELGEPFAVIDGIGNYDAA